MSNESRGKEKRPVWIYLNGVFIAKTESLSEASDITRINISSIGLIMKGKQKCTREGYAFSDHKLNEQEIDELPIKKHKEKRSDKGICCKKVDRQVYDVSCDKFQVCYFPKSKEERVDEFKKFLYVKFKDRWRVIPHQLATLEKVYIQEFFETI